MGHGCYDLCPEINLVGYAKCRVGTSAAEEIDDCAEIVGGFVGPAYVHLAPELCKDFREENFVVDRAALRDLLARAGKFLAMLVGRGEDGEVHCIASFASSDSERWLLLAASRRSVWFSCVRSSVIATA